MELPAIQFSQDDVFRFKVQVSRTETQDSVQLRVPVTALIQALQPDPSVLDASIREALQSFIATEWVFSAIKREGDAVGFERLSLTATARVPNSEIYNLRERARVVGREGLEVGTPVVNYKLPEVRVNAANTALRLQVIEQVKAEIPMLNKASGRDWRIGQIEFGVRSDSDEEDSSRYRKGGYRSASEEAIDADAGLAGGEKFSLLAEITLKCRVTES